MTRDEAIAQIQQGLGFRSDRQNEIVNALQQAQRLLELGRTLPNFLIARRQTLTIDAGTGALTLPTGFLRLFEEPEMEGAIFLLDENDNEYYALERVNRGTTLRRFTDSDPGKPIAYSLEGKSGAVLYVYPERDVEYSASWGYYQSGGELSTNSSTNLWLVNNPEALIGRAGMLIAEDLRNGTAYAKFEKLYTNAWASGFADDIQSDEADAPLSMGELL